MKKIFAILTICGAFAFSSCTKHACPAYGATPVQETPATLPA